MITLRRSALCALLVALCASNAQAKPPPEADFRRWQDWFWFAGGAASAFIVHEVSHLTMDAMLGKTVHVEKVQLGPFPFFSLTACCNLTRNEEWIIASAGFVSQQMTSELILQLAPSIRQQRRPFLKGVLMFDILLALGYAVTGFANIGPPSSDVMTMSRAMQVEPWRIGLMLTIPATVDLVRYFAPELGFAPWVSVTGKIITAGAFLTF